MRKSLCYAGTLLMLLACATASYAQSIILNGSIKNESTQEILPAASVIVKGTNLGTFSDSKGNFKLTTSQKLPLTLVITSIGFEPKEIEVTSALQDIAISITPASTLGTEIVVSASRVPERILESPVSIERVNSTAIRVAPAATYYDIVGNLKGVDVVTSSLTFKTPTTRGFAGSGNTRFNQLVDGMDNQAPGLNFSVGAIIGLSELDVDNMELLPGASSALYGPGGMNGTLLVSSKSPFKYTGVSAQVKTGLMNAGKKYRNTSSYHNWAIRYAENIKDKFAFKINAEFIQAKDWLGADDRNYNRLIPIGKIIPGTRTSDPNYDGVNVYGDETTVNIQSAVFPGIATAAPFLAPYINSLGTSPIYVSRTGYAEKDAIDPNTLNFKIGGAFHYRITPKVEAVLAGTWGTGNSVYTGSDRYSFKDFKMGQYKFELNAKNWFIRTYTTQENAGQSYNATVTTRRVNEAWKPSTTWYPQYTQAYLGALIAGSNNTEAHNIARAVADQGRPLPGSTQFKALYDQVRSVPISKGGGLFIEKSDLYQTEAQYNFSSITSKVADIIVGGNYRVYSLNSEGTLFADTAGRINIWEIGAYIQATKRLLHDKLKLTFSGRYDKNKNFSGRFTPRVTAVVEVAKNSNVRLSYQTAYRFPSTQQQFINLEIGGGTFLIGGDKTFQRYYNFDKNKPYNITTNAGQPFTFQEFKPESVSSYELGYKSLIANNKLLIDAYGYYGVYTNFIARTVIGQPATTGAAPAPATDKKFSVPINVSQNVKTYGYGLSLDYRLGGGFSINTNVSSDILKDIPAGFVAFFNAPKYRANIGLSNTGIGKSKLVGFSVTYKWQDAFFYEGDFANGNINAIHTLDAQVSRRLPAIRSVIKLGANNLLNQYYFNAVGNSIVGGLYYVAFGYNIF
jgi:outer membrane receptor protein involved in Fe transport